MKGLENGDMPKYLVCEKKIIYELLMICAGMMGAYTFNLRGGVFCNAQTANVVLMSLHLGKGEWEQGFYFLIPIFAYLMGAFLSEFLPKPMKKFELFRWDTFLIGIEMLVLFIVGWIPLSMPNQIVQVTINFICSMQYNTFRQAEGIPMATTFCTNHVRQVGVAAAKYMRKKDKSALQRGLVHIAMLAGFCAGGIILTAFCNAFQEKVIWLALIPLGVALVMLVRADLFLEREMLDKVPSGH